MAVPRAKRRKLSPSSEEGLPEAAGNGYASESSSDASPSAIQPKAHSEPNPPGQTSQNRSRTGIRENGKHYSGPKVNDEQRGAVNSAGGSSLMILQINDLLGEITPDCDKLISRLEKTLDRLQQIILDLPDIGPNSVVDAERCLRKEAGIRVPFSSPRPTKDTKYTLEYRRPEEIGVVGSLQHQLAIKSKDTGTADLAVTLPDSILQEKDFLNHRYFHKRAFYIAQLAAGIRRHAKNEFKLSFEHQDGIASKPALIIEPTESSPSGFLRSKYRIRIILVVNATVFPPNKTLPAKCCLRNYDDTSATPYYNACVRSEATTGLYHDLLQKTISQCNAFQDVCRLGRLWLRQRGFGGSISRGGFGPFEWSIVCALLLQSGGTNGRPAFSPRYTCLQFFKAMLQFLAAKDLTDPLFLNGATCEIAQSDSPVLFDGAAQLNVLFKMTPWSYQLLRQEARSTIEAFSSRAVDNFESIFVKRVDEDLLRFDQCMLLKATALLQKQDEHPNAQGPLQRLHAILSQALGNRVRLIHLEHDHSPKWSTDKPLKQDPRAHDVIRIGLFVDSDHVDRLVDRGPSAEDQAAAAEFRKFWGEKVELRRFRDGSITESLVWSEETPVTEQVTSYILQRHFDIASSALTFLGHQVEHLARNQSSVISRKSAFKLVNDAFQSLNTDLRQLEGLPLSIRSILPASSQLRCASLSPPLTSIPIHPIDITIEFEGSARWPDSLPAIQRTKIAFLIKLGDLLSASNSKITTLIGLENTSSGPASDYSNISFLDIIIPSPTPHLVPPIPFRLRIHHDRTLTLLQTALSTIPPSQRPLLTTTLQTHTRNFLSQPPHTTTFARLATLYPSLPSAIHLLKTWTSSHHLTCLIPEETIEILAARPYLHPYPYPAAPGRAQTAFLRALRFIASWDWKTEPLIVDLSPTTTNNNNNHHHHPTINADESGGGLTTEAVANLHTRFTAWRQQLDPALTNVVWFIGTNLDRTGVAWTQAARPPQVVAARFTALARASLDLLVPPHRPGGRRRVVAAAAAAALRERERGLDPLFRSGLAHFDFVIHLEKRFRAVAGPAAGRGRRDFKNLLPIQHPAGMDVATATAAAAAPAVGFDPVTLFRQDLERCFGQSVLFFYGGGGGGSEGVGAGGAGGGGVIAALWHPKVLGRGRREWRLGMGWSSVPLSALGSVPRPGEEEEEEEEEGGKGRMKVEGVVNQRGILAEIEMLGLGIVERVEVIRELEL